MIIKASVGIDVAVGVAGNRLYRALGHGGMEPISDQAYARGLTLLLRVGPFGGIAGLSKQVRLQMLEPRAVPDGLRVPLRWVATGPGGALFPALDADLELTATGADSSLLTLTEAYRPPLGTAGAGIDQLLLRRVAQATVRTLLRSSAQTLCDHPASTQIAPASHGPRLRVSFAQTDRHSARVDSTPANHSSF